MEPLVIFGAQGKLLAVAACNSKSRSKSVEQGELWILRPDNGRVLPWRGGQVRCGTFAERQDDGAVWYEVSVTVAGVPAGAPVENKKPAAGALMEADTPVAADTPPDDETAPVAVAQPLPGLPVLSELADVIARRHRTMPPGSYTTHLFEKGASKIRKKTGEEAVELILAETREEIVSETADLLYHAMVLLEQEGVRIEEVVAELQRRHAKSS